MRVTQVSFALLALGSAGCGVATLDLDGPEGSATSLSSRPLPPADDAGEPPPPPRPEVDAGTPGVDAGEPGCESGAVEACTSGCGSTGTRRCSGTVWPGCVPPVESCDNGVDDDCDSKVDHADFNCTPPVSRCEDTEGGGCNGDLGYGDRCSAADNEEGCSPARFYAWCNRRNPATPNIWDTWIETWVDSRCDGTTVLTGATYHCLSSNNERFECTTPLVLVFEPGARVEFIAPSQRFTFTAGRPVMSDWPTAASPWLVRDLNQNGAIDDGSELFGSSTRLPNGRIAANGFEALAALDSNGDGAVDAADPAFDSLGVWRDENGNRRVEDGELTRLAEEGVDRLSTRFRLQVECNRRGDCERERAPFSGAVRGELVDVYLRVEALACW